jgi:hypothetical protein
MALHDAPNYLLSLVRQARTDAGAAPLGGPFRVKAKADLTAPKSNFRFTPDSGLMSDNAACPLSADFVAEVGCCRWAVGHFVMSGRL